MGMLVEGRWTDEDRTIQGGAYVRPNSPYGEPLSEEVVQGVAAEPGRFHLIASLSCPWSHRAMLVRVLKGLDDVVPLHIARGPRTQGYRVGTVEHPWTVTGAGDAIEHLHQLYARSDPTCTGRVTVPVLWDAARSEIVSNESIHILRGLDTAKLPSDEHHSGLVVPDWTLRPPSLANEIDALALHIQAELSNAVYRAGKAQQQDVYDAAVEEVFGTLAMLEERLGQTRYLHGNALTETDLRLWPTLVRFDAVYHGHFKCTRRRLIDHPNLWTYARDLLTWRGVAATFDEGAIRAAYYGEDRNINPHGIVATAPEMDWTTPHGRDVLGPAMVTLRGGRTAVVDPMTFATNTASAA